MNKLSESKIEKPEAKYGFYDRLTADFPSQVIIDTTEFCNLACIHCLSSSGRRDPHELSTAEAKAVIDELRRIC